MKEHNKLFRINERLAAENSKLREQKSKLDQILFYVNWLFIPEEVRFSLNHCITTGDYDIVLKWLENEFNKS